MGAMRLKEKKMGIEPGEGDAWARQRERARSGGGERRETDLRVGGGMRRGGGRVGDVGGVGMEVESGDERVVGLSLA